MKIFTHVKKLDDSKLHEKFKFLRDNCQVRCEKELLESWTDGMVDKDKKMVREFQKSFHSCFWEFYLYKLFKQANFDIDQSHQMPDFIITNPVPFYVEAVVSNIKDGGNKETERTVEDQFALMLPPYVYEQFYVDLDESITRHANSIQHKLKKYKGNYIKLKWVDTNAPYVVALSSYDQINYGREYIYSMVALLYGLYYDAGSDFFYKRDSIKKPGTDSDIPLGIFVNDALKEDYCDVSAIIFTCSLTLGKLTSLVISQGGNSLNKVYNIRKYENKYVVQTVSVDCPELLEDGIFIFHNPNARNVLDEKAFLGTSVTQFYFDGQQLKLQGNETPLIARHNTSILLEEISWRYVQECVRLYNRLTPEDYYDSSVVI